MRKGEGGMKNDSVIIVKKSNRSPDLKQNDLQLLLVSGKQSENVLFVKKRLFT